MTSINHTRSEVNAPKVNQIDHGISDADLLSVLQDHQTEHEQQKLNKLTTHQFPRKLEQRQQLKQQYKKLACLYTAQKLKKKKTFHDGVLKVSLDTNFVSLHRETSSSSQTLDNPLDTRVMAHTEINDLLSGNLSEIEFEGFLVQIDEVEEEAKTCENDRQCCNKKSSSSSGSGSTGSIDVPRMTKFKIPSRVVPKVLSIPMSEGTGTSSGTSGLHNNPIIRNVTGKRAYDVGDDELDAIWGAGDVSGIKMKKTMPSMDNPSSSLPLREVCLEQQESGVWDCNEVNSSSRPAVGELEAQQWLRVQSSTIALDRCHYKDNKIDLRPNEDQQAHVHSQITFAHTAEAMASPTFIHKANHNKEKSIWGDSDSDSD